MPYIPHTSEDQSLMLQTIGVERVQDLFSDVPPGMLAVSPPDLPPPQSEMEVVAQFRDLASRNASNETHICLLGGGVYDHYMPSIVPALIRRSEYLTAYAPYQAEMSQGTLHAMFEYQTMMCRLTRMDIANSSFYDGASALAAAILMAHRKKPGRLRVLLGHYSPAQAQVVRTHLEGLPIELEFLPLNESGRLAPEALADEPRPGEILAVAASCPNAVGVIPDMSALSEATHALGAFFIASVDPLSLGVLNPPGLYSADIAVGEAQCLGNPMNFGGPLLGLMAAKDSFLRQMPGRIAGAGSDGEGRRGYVMTLQTREQHVRREKATSNICSNQALNALAACIYLAALGKRGLTDVAEQCLHKANYLFREIQSIPGYAAVFPGAPIFKEFVVRCPRPARELIGRALAHKILLGIPLEETTGHPHDLLMAVTEQRTRSQLDHVLEFLRNEPVQ